MVCPTKLLTWSKYLELCFLDQVSIISKNNFILTELDHITSDSNREGDIFWSVHKRNQLLCVNQIKCQINPENAKPKPARLKIQIIHTTTSFSFNKLNRLHNGTRFVVSRLPKHISESALWFSRGPSKSTRSTLSQQIYVLDDSSISRD